MILKLFSFAGNSHRRFDEDTDFTLIKVVVLGAPGVGKTSIVKVSYPFQITSLKIRTMLPEWVNRKAPDDEILLCALKFQSPCAKRVSGRSLFIRAKNL